MMDYPYPTNFEAALPGNPVKEACVRAVAATGADSIREAAGLMYNGTDPTKVYSFFILPSLLIIFSTSSASTSWKNTSTAPTQPAVELAHRLLHGTTSAALSKFFQEELMARPICSPSSNSTSTTARTTATRHTVSFPIATGSG